MDAIFPPCLILFDLIYFLRKFTYLEVSHFIVVFILLLIPSFLDCALKFELIIRRNLDNALNSTDLIFIFAKTATFWISVSVLHTLCEI
jgi:hypothetical protein